MAFQRMVSGISYLIFGVVLYLCVDHLIQEKNDQPRGIGKRLRNAGKTMTEPNCLQLEQDIPLMAELPHRQRRTGIRDENPKIENPMMTWTTPKIIIHEEEDLIELKKIGK